MVYKLGKVYIQGVSIYSGLFHVTDLNLDLGQLNTPFLGFPTIIKTLVKYILKSIINTANFIVNSGNFIVNSSNKMLNNLNSTKTLLPVSSFGKDNNGRFLTLTMLNKNLLEYEPLLEAIYNTLTTHKMYKELSDNKIVFATAVIEGREYSFHPNILLTENSTFESYKNSVIKYITEKYIEGNYGYSNSLVHEIIVKVWDVSHLKNKIIKLVSNNGLRISCG